MSHTVQEPTREQGTEMATLTTDLRIRVLNCSGAGCLLESTQALDVGTIAQLRITFSNGDFEDTVQVVRCQPITGGPGVYHIGTTFLATTPPSLESLRYFIRRETGSVGGWLRLEEIGVKEG